MQSSLRQLLRHCPVSAASHAVVSVLLVLLAVALSLGTVHTASDLLDLRHSLTGIRATVSWLASALTVALTFSSAWYVAKRDRPIKPLIFLSALFAVTVALRSVLIANVDPVWVSDYLRYWDRAIEMAADGGASLKSIYHQRALLVPYPVELLFGPNATLALKWTNAALLFVIQLAVYDAVRLTSSHQAAQGAAILLLGSPLPAYAVQIPSHDLWGLVFLSGVLWTAARAYRLPRAPLPRIAGLTLLGVGSAVLAYCLELQRSLGTLTAIALLGSSILLLALQKFRPNSPGERHSGAAITLVAALTLALQPVITAGTQHIGLEPVSSSHAAMAMKYAAHGSSMGTARSAWYARFNDRFYRATVENPAQVDDFASSIILSTWMLEPAGKLDAIRQHTARLFSLSYPSDWDTLLRRPAGLNPELRTVLLIHIATFGLALLISAVVAALSLVPRIPSIPHPILACTILTVGLASVLLVLFENKPFNVAPAWLLLPMLVGFSLTRRSTAFGDAPHPSSPPIQLTLLAVAACVFGIVSGWFVLRLIYDTDDGLMLSNWKLHVIQSRPSAPQWITALASLPPKAFDQKYYVRNRREFVLRDAADDAKRIKRRADSMFFTLRFPPGVIAQNDTVTAHRSLCSNSQRDSLEFFMFAPYQREDVHRVFTLEVARDGTLLSTMPIPHEDRSDSMQRVIVPDIVSTDGRCHDVTLTLRSNVDRSALSWSRASHVEIWFPRLVRN